MGGARFYDSSAQAQRMLCSSREAADSLEQELDRVKADRDRSLDEMLRAELLAQRKPRSKSKVRAAETVVKKAAGKDADGPARAVAQG
jgi:hypothetical protein